MSYAFCNISKEEVFSIRVSVKSIVARFMNVVIYVPLHKSSLVYLAVNL